MTNTKTQQRGASFFAILIILAVVAFFALCIMKVGPLYLENGAVKAALDNLLEQEGIGKKGTKAIRKKIDAQFSVDDVKSIGWKDVKIAKSKSGKAYVVTAEYEARTGLFSNLGVHVNFSHTVEVPR